MLAMVLAESCLLALLGGLAGLGIAWLIISRGDPTHGSLPMFYLPDTSIGIGLLLIIGLGLVAGIVPAFQAMRLRVADALRRM